MFLYYISFFFISNIYFVNKSVLMVLIFFFMLMFFFNMSIFPYMLFFFLLEMTEFSWNGSILLVEGFYNWSLVYLGLLIYLIIMMSERKFMVKLLSTSLLVIGMYFFFCSNFIIFFSMLELSVMPVLFLVLGFGSQIEKISASYYLLFYTAITGLPFILYFFYLEGFFFLVYSDFILSEEMSMFMVMGFLMKFPVYFLHYWLPKVHVESPTSASMLLAGYLLKFGTHGFGRFLGSLSYLNLFWFFFISFLGMVICCFMCMFQSDSKSMIAYSSVVHMSFLLMVFLLFSGLSKNSGLMMMISHGYISVISFFFLGEMVHYLQVRIIYYFNSLFISSYFFSMFLAVTLLMNSGLPMSLSFFSEFSGLTSMFVYMKWSLVLMCFYFFFSFYYSLYIIVFMFLGKNYVKISESSTLFILPYLFMSFNIFFYLMI